MEVKKSPAADLESKKMLFLAVGLIVALAVSGFAFAWSSMPEPQPYSPSVKQVAETELDKIDRTDQQKEEPKMENKKVQTAVIQDAIKIMSNTAENIKTPELVFSEDANDMFSVNMDDFDDMGEVVEEESAEDDVFTILEDPATFRGGGLPEFRKWVMEHLRYPQIAQENGIQGNVVIEFVINESGAVDRIKVLQSPDQSLADAAIATLKKSPKWKPGKQRGKAVKQKFVLPVAFKLQN
jgi:protein TonB